MTSSLLQLSDAFAVLGHPTKLRIYKHLFDSRNNKTYPLVPTMVGISLDIRPSVAAYSMKRMHQVGILTRQVTGKYSFYGIDPHFLKQVKEFFNEGS